LDFLDEFASENPKNYQLWYHRRAIIEMSQDPSREFDFTDEVFDTDAKNYHAWAHRFVFLCFFSSNNFSDFSFFLFSQSQWVIRTFNLFDKELAFVDKCIEKDVRNNSAWNQVSFSLLFSLLSLMFSSFHLSFLYHIIAMVCHSRQQEPASHRGNNSN
jgi:protein farnesyltransferase/geranylgeranyltransferase type-1 subunit alpha